MAHFCLHKLHMLPSEFLKLERAERAFIVASINVRLDREEKERAKSKSKRKGR